MSALAFLPMYDVPGTRSHADALWESLRDCIRERGLEAPDQIDRTLGRHDGWLHPDLVLGQTCGLPYMKFLCDDVELVGTPDYGVNGCPPGFYHSSIVVRAVDTRGKLGDFFGGTLAFNGTDSQSGYAAIMRAVAPMALQGRFFGRALCAGSHRRAMQLVADGAADIAAIDTVTWRISSSFDPLALKLKSIETTEPTPGLPFIAGKGKPAKTLLEAARCAVAALPSDTRNAFGLRDVLPFRRQDYEVIVRNLAEAEAAHALPPIEMVSPEGAKT